MGKKSGPPAPDYTKAAEATAQSNQSAQARADWANRPTINTPWGQQSWGAQQGVDPATGEAVTNWTMNLNLSPQQQSALNDQMAIQSGRSDIAQGMLGRLGEAYQQPFNWGGMQGYGQAPQAQQGLMGGLDPSLQQGVQRQLDPSLQGGIQQSVGGYGDESRQRIEQGMLDRLRPEHQQQQASLENQLRGQGLSRGSEAWNREMQRLGDQQSRSQFDALMRGGEEQQRQFGMGLQAGQFGNQAQAQRFGQGVQSGQFQNQAQAQQFGQGLQSGQFQNQAQAQGFGQGMQQAEYDNRLRQQQIAEQSLQRSMPLNELNALLGGQQVGMPQMPSFNTSQPAGAVNYSGAAQQQYNAGLDQYNAQQAARQGLFSGLGGLAGLGIMGGLF